MAPTQQLQIVGGDAKDKLLAQLFDLGRMKLGRPSFKLEVQTPDGKKDFEVCVNGIEAEDGSGDRWMISGYIVIPQLSHTIHWLAGYGNRFHAYYDTRTRKGWMKPQK